MDLTLGNAAALRAAEILEGAQIIPIHADSWAHFRQSTAQMKTLFEAHGRGKQLLVLAPGDSIVVSGCRPDTGG